MKTCRRQEVIARTPLATHDEMVAAVDAAAAAFPAWSATSVSNRARVMHKLEHLIRAVDVVLRGGRFPPNHAREEGGPRACGPVRKARVQRLKHELVRRIVADAEDEVDAANLRGAPSVKRGRGEEEEGTPPACE